MAITSSLQITGTLTLPTGKQAVTTPSFANASASGQRTFPALSSGDNTISVPSGAKHVLIQPASTNAVALALKKTGTDAGWNLDLTGPNLISMASVSNFVLNAGGSVSAGAVEISFF